MALDNQRFRAWIASLSELPGEMQEDDLIYVLRGATSHKLPFGPDQLIANLIAGASAGSLQDLVGAGVEVGTFDMSYTTSGTDFSSVTYGSRSFRYFKVGRLVHIQGVVFTDAVTKGSASGAVRLNGLPFTAANNSAGVNGRSALSVAEVSGFLADAPLQARVHQSSTEVRLLKRATSVSSDVNLQVSDIATGATANSVHIAGTYITEA